MHEIASMSFFCASDFGLPIEEVAPNILGHLDEW